MYWFPFSKHVWEEMKDNHSAMVGATAYPRSSLTHAYMYFRRTPSTWATVTASSSEPMARTGRVGLLPFLIATDSIPYRCTWNIDALCLEMVLKPVVCLGTSHGYMAAC